MVEELERATLSVSHGRWGSGSHSNMWPLPQFVFDDRTERQRERAAWGNPAGRTQTKAASTLSLTCYTLLLPFLSSSQPSHSFNHLHSFVLYTRSFVHSFTRSGKHELSLHDSGGCKRTSIRIDPYAILRHYACRKLGPTFIAWTCGRVVKALDSGSSHESGKGSNPFGFKSIISFCSFFGFNNNYYFASICCFIFVAGSTSLSVPVVFFSFRIQLVFLFSNNSQQWPFLQPVSMDHRSSNEPETSPLFKFENSRCEP